MKCGPDDCPIRAFSDLTPAEQRVERKRIAKKMYDQGFTMEQVAKQLGVTHATISNDLREFVSDLQIKKPAKTASNPKGAGRPKGSKPRKEQSIKREERVETLMDAGLTAKEIAAEIGVVERAIHQVMEHIQIKREAKAEPDFDRADLAVSAQKKFDTAVRREMQRLAASFEQRVREDVRRRVDEFVLPAWKEKIKEAQRIYERRKGIMDKATFRLIWSALHPDSRNSITDKKLAEAFDAFSAMEKFLLDEKNSPTVFGALPSSLAEWDKMRMKRPSKQTAATASAVRPR